MQARGLPGKIGAAAASVAVALLFAELALAILRPQDRSVWSHTRDGLVIHPASIETYLPRFGQWVRTNAWGMRDRPRALEKTSGTFRVLLLGDSFTEALQVAFEESLPSLLEAGLSERTGRAIEVINASTSGWGTDDEVTYLQRYGMRFRPDLVLIAMTLHNDVSDNLALEHHDFRGGKIVERRRPETGAAEWALIRARDFIANRSHLYGVYRRLKALRRGGTEGQALEAHVASLIRREPDPRTAQGWEVTRQLLDGAHRIAREAGSETAVFMIPLFIQVSQQRLERFLADHGMHEDEIDLDQPQRVAAQWGTRAAVAVIDLLPEFRSASRDGGSFYLANDGHWNRAGHALAADVVARELVARGVNREGDYRGPTVNRSVWRRATACSAPRAGM